MDISLVSRNTGIHGTLDSTSPLTYYTGGHISSHSEIYVLSLFQGMTHIDQSTTQMASVAHATAMVMSQKHTEVLPSFLLVIS